MATVVQHQEPLLSADKRHKLVFGHVTLQLRHRLARWSCGDCRVVELAACDSFHIITIFIS